MPYFDNSSSFVNLCQVVYVAFHIGIHERTDGVTYVVTKFSRINRFPISVAKELQRARSLAVFVDLKGVLID